jgi:adenylate cyclase
LSGKKEIPVDEAKSLLLYEKVQSTKLVMKYSRNHTYEVDEFYGENQGLIIAEIELQSEEEAFENQTGWDRK